MVWTLLYLFWQFLSLFFDERFKGSIMFKFIVTLEGCDESVISIVPLSTSLLPYYRRMHTQHPCRWKDSTQSACRLAHQSVDV